MTMAGGVTIVCDQCGYDCSEEKEFRGFKHYSAGKLERLLIENNWMLRQEMGPFYNTGVLTPTTKHYCPSCSKIVSSDTRG